MIDKNSEEFTSLVDFLSDGWYYKVENLSNEDVENIRRNIIKPIQNMLCALVGHNAIPDHCNIPEHDYCWTCGALTPCQAKR